MGLTTRQTHTEWGTGRERRADGWKVTTQSASQPFIHSDGQSASQPISPSLHSGLRVTAADKRCTIFLWHFVKNLLFSSLDPLISSRLSVLHLSFPAHGQVLTSTEDDSQRKQKLCCLKCRMLQHPLWCQDHNYWVFDKKSFYRFVK